MKTHVHIKDGAIQQSVNDKEAFTINGIRHSPGWIGRATQEQLAERGLVQIEVPPLPDPELQEVVGRTEAVLDEKGVPRAAHIVASKDLAAAKAAIIARLKRMAFTELSQTDWLIVRQAEGGGAPGPGVVARRTAIRNAVADAETAINNAGTHAAVAEVLSSFKL